MTSGFLSLCGFSSPFLTIGCKHSYKRCTCCLCLCMYIYTWVEDGGRRVTSGFLFSVAFPHLSLLLGINTLQEVYMLFVSVYVYIYLCGG